METFYYFVIENNKATSFGSTTDEASLPDNATVIQQSEFDTYYNTYVIGGSE